MLWCQYIVNDIMFYVHLEVYIPTVEQYNFHEYYCGKVKPHASLNCVLTCWLFVKPYSFVSQPKQLVLLSK